MEFNEKLQVLRRQKGLTQEELAGALYVSRTAVSKWESGRGYPNIESLKAIAKFFSVSIDELLSCEEALTIAEEDGRQRERNLRDLAFALLDICAAALFFMPFFGQQADGRIYGVSLLSMTGTEGYLKTVYIAAVTAITVYGMVTLILQNCRQRLWLRIKGAASFALTAAGALLFIVSAKPYAAAYLFVFTVIKAIMLAKRQ